MLIVIHNMPGSTQSVSGTITAEAGGKKGHWDCSVPLWWYNPMDVPRTPVGWEGHWDCNVPLLWYNPIAVPRTPMRRGMGKNVEIAVPPFGGTIPWMSLRLHGTGDGKGHWDCSAPLWWNWMSLGLPWDRGQERTLGLQCPPLVVQSHGCP